MLGTFQQSQLRVEVDASAKAIADLLLLPENWATWLLPRQFYNGLPETLTPGVVYTLGEGAIVVNHEVQSVTDHSLRLILSGGVDGYHEWKWGEGWVQARLEGVSILPLKLSQTLTLGRLRLVAAQRSKTSA
ncbi:MAG: hypothetical protein AAGA67_09250 [Cyanobacteria bacterium P01_F01_bin.153]